ncbi:aspartyl/asparaginyl beta-hydroxylase domain-containing protein [Streptomyces sp. M10(2022)]
MVLDGVEQRWQPGTLWYADFERPHSLRNAGDRTRIHLVADCATNDKLLALFPDSFRADLPTSDIAYYRPFCRSRRANSPSSAVPSRCRSPSWSGDFPWSTTRRATSPPK